MCCSQSAWHSVISVYGKPALKLVKVLILIVVFVQGVGEKRLSDDKETDGAAAKKTKFEVCTCSKASWLVI